MTTDPTPAPSASPSRGNWLWVVAWVSYCLLQWSSAPWNDFVLDDWLGVLELDGRETPRDVAAVRSAVA